MSRTVLTVILCSLAAMLDGFDIQALGLAIPGMAREFGLHPTAITMAITASLVGMALGAMTLAPLGDRLGRKPMILALLLLIGITTLAAGWAQDPVMLAVIRFFSGLGMGAVFPVAIAVVAEEAPPERRTALVTLMVACSPIGSFAAGFIAPIVEPVYSWRGIFAVGGAATLVAAGLVWIALPHPRAAQPSPLKPALSSLFVPEYRARTILLWVIFGINLFVTYSLISWLPTLLSEAGWAKADAQRATGLMALGGVCGGLLIAWAADKGLAIPALAATYVITAFLFVLFVIGPGGKPAWMVLLTLVGAGAMGAQMAAGSFSATFYPSAIRATGLGWSGGVGRIGAIIGPLVIASLLKAAVPGEAILALLLIPMLACAYCVTRLPKALAV
jgi:MFS transporter, AAHS family, 4-hydroxybenzoate transporter